MNGETKVALIEGAAMVLAVLLPVLLPLLFRWMKKTGIDIDAKTQLQITDLVRDGLRYAEEQARKRVRTKDVQIGGDAKLSLAMDYVLDEARARRLKVSPALIQRRIEAHLNRERDYMPTGQIVAVLALALASATGCGASALQTHAAAVAASHEFLTASKTALDGRLEAAAEPAVEAHRDGRLTAAEARAQADAAIDAEAARLAPVIAAHNAMAAAHTLYATGVLTLERDGKLTLRAGVELALAVLEAYRQVAEALAGVGIDVPPPAALLGLEAAE